MRQIFLALLASSVFACSSDSHQPSSLRVVIHDAPADVDEVWVEFAGVSAHHADAGWLTVSNDVRAVDLLTLQGGVFEELGLAVLEPGRYDQVRLDLTRAWVVVDGVTHDLDVPSGAQSGLKIGHGFDVLDCGQTTLSLDWDVGAHLHQDAAQRYTLRPVVHVDAVTVEGCGPVLVEQTQVVTNTWSIGVWDYYGHVAAWMWQYQGYQPFDPALGTLRSVRAEQTFDVTFDRTNTVPGEHFSFRTVFAGGGLWSGGSFEIVNDAEHETYTFTQEPPLNDWSNTAWGYYFETYAKNTPHSITNMVKLTYVYEE